MANIICTRVQDVIVNITTPLEASKMQSIISDSTAQSRPLVVKHFMLFESHLFKLSQESLTLKEKQLSDYIRGAPLVQSGFPELPTGKTPNMGNGTIDSIAGSESMFMRPLRSDASRRERKGKASNRFEIRLARKSGV